MKVRMQMLTEEELLTQLLEDVDPYKADSSGGKAGRGTPTGSVEQRPRIT
jgi:hypothetical protein